MNKLTIELFRDNKRNFRWHMKRCGRIVAESGESYKRGKTMLKTLLNLLTSIDSKQYNVNDLTK